MSSLCYVQVQQEKLLIFTSTCTMRVRFHTKGSKHRQVLARRDALTLALPSGNFRSSRNSNMHCHNGRPEPDVPLMFVSV